MKNHVYITIIMTTIMFSCSTIIKIGKPYKAKGSQIDEIIFNTDTTFVYNYSFGFKKFYSEGSWINNKNEIILNSNYCDLKKVPINIEEKQIPEKNKKIDFVINESVIDSILYFTLIVNKKLYYDIGYAKSFYLADTIEIRELKVFVDLKNMYHTPVTSRIVTRNYNVKSIDANYFKINIPIYLNDFYYKKNRENKIKVLNKKLKWQDKIYYIK